MKCQVLIDWLTFSVKETDPSKVIQTYLGMDPALCEKRKFFPCPYPYSLHCSCYFLLVTTLSRLYIPSLGAVLKYKIFSSAAELIRQPGRFFRS